MNQKAVSILLVGIGGYGGYYLNELLSSPVHDEFIIAGVVDVRPESSNHYAKLIELNIPIYDAMEHFFAESSADLTVISTPIQYHCRQTCLALENGSNVLCEKPIGATVQEALKMKEVRDRTGKFVAIGFNLCYDNQIRQLKRDIQSGEFGKPKQLKTVVLWSRDEAYYSRGWAGRRKSDAGDWILDSIAHNATSHYLHNMFFVLGEKFNESAQPQSVLAELYRANTIENFDTCAVRALTEEKVEILFYATHAILDSVGPRFSFEFEKATITYGYEHTGKDIKVSFHDGSEKIYPGVGENDRKLWECVDLVRQGSQDVPCAIEAALAEVVCINGMHESVPEISTFPDSLTGKDAERKVVWVKGLSETLLSCYEQGNLPSESGTDWANSGKLIDLRGYNSFKG